MGRKSNKQIEGESGRWNLEGIEELAKEAQELGEGLRGYRAVYLRNEGDVRRWLRQMKDAGMPCPSAINRNFSTWKY